MAAEWDAAAGVYKNARAASSCEVPDPLWIFGYGSLVWRPEERWSDYDAKPCAVRGWRRYFAQLSTDHRGVPGAPGLVCTLLEDAPEVSQSSGREGRREALLARALVEAERVAQRVHPVGVDGRADAVDERQRVRRGLDDERVAGRRRRVRDLPLGEAQCVRDRLHILWFRRRLGREAGEAQDAVRHVRVHRELGAAQREGAAFSIIIERLGRRPATPDVGRGAQGPRVALLVPS